MYADSEGPGVQIASGGSGDPTVHLDEREDGGKARTHRMFLLPKSLSWTGRGGSALKDVTEDSRNGPGAIMEGFMEEAMNTTESDAENYNNHNNNQHVLNTYYIPGPAP